MNHDFDFLIIDHNPSLTLHLLLFFIKWLIHALNFLHLIFSFVLHLLRFSTFFLNHMITLCLTLRDRISQNEENDDIQSEVPHIDEVQHHDLVQQHLLWYSTIICLVHTTPGTAPRFGTPP